MTCPWCETPVTHKGYTCSYLCYLNWWLAAYQHMTGTNRLVSLDPDGRVIVPLDIEEQPWYDQHTTGEQ